MYQNEYTHSTAVDLSRKKSCGTILAFVAATFSPLPIAGSSTSPYQVWRSWLRPIPVPTATVFEAPRQALGMPLLPTLMMCPLGRSSPPPIRLPRPTGSLTWHGSRTPAREADITDPATFRTGIQGLSTQIQALIRKSQQRDQISEIVPCPRSAAPPFPDPFTFP